MDTSSDWLSRTADEGQRQPGLAPSRGAESAEKASAVASLPSVSSLAAGPTSPSTRSVSTTRVAPPAALPATSASAAIMPAPPVPTSADPQQPSPLAPPSSSLSAPSPIFDSLAFASPLERAQQDAAYQATRRQWTPLYPPEITSRLRKQAKARGGPSVSPTLLGALEMLEESGELARLKDAHAKDWIIFRSMPMTNSMEQYYATEEHKVIRKREAEVLWLDGLWQECLKVERSAGIEDEARSRARFKRFPPTFFPTLAERNAAESDPHYTPLTIPPTSSILPFWPFS